MASTQTLKPQTSHRHLRFTVKIKGVQIGRKHPKRRKNKNDLNFQCWALYNSSKHTLIKQPEYKIKNTNLCMTVKETNSNTLS